MNTVSTYIEMSLFQFDSGQDANTEIFAMEPRYRKFALQLDKCLSSFEGIQDWGDCTAFLNRLLKVRLSLSIHFSCSTS